MRKLFKIFSFSVNSISVKSALALAWFITSCASLRTQESNRVPQSTTGVLKTIDEMLKTIRDPSTFNSQTCGQTLKTWTDLAYNTDPIVYFPNNPSDDQKFRENGTQVLHTLAALQFSLRARLIDLDFKDRDCDRFTRRAFRYIRSAQDYVIDMLYDRGMIKAGSDNIFSGGYPYTTRELDADRPVGVGEQAIEFKAGDVILGRGHTFVGAMIARIGDEEANFSHLALVTKDPSSGELYVMESLSEVGVVAQPLKVWLATEKEVRALAFRYHDSSVAEEAATRMHAYWLSHNKHLSYDFSMDSEDHSRIYCSEVISFAYSMAGVNDLPVSMTSLASIQNTKIYKDMTISVQKIFAPSDFELDPRFTLLAEYRHVGTIENDEAAPAFNGLSHLNKVRIQDAMMTSVVSWIRQRQYDIRPELVSNVLGRTAKGMRNLGFAKTKIEPDMPPSVIALFIKLSRLNNHLEKIMAAIDKQHRETSAFHAPMFFKELLKATEDYRVRDCKVWKHYYEVTDNERGLKESRKSPPVMPEFHMILSPTVSSTASCDPIDVLN